MRTLTIVLLAAVAVAIGFALWPTVRPVATPTAAAATPLEPRAMKPRKPPGPNDPHPPPVPEPTMPTPSPEWRAALADRVRGTAHPGETAFRALSDLFVDSNIGFANEQAAHEGITLPEVRELTHFGLIVLATQRANEVEELIGRALSDEERERMAALMRSANEGFKQEMRALVARNASETERWELIRATEGRYRRELFTITGLNDELLDDLLAGNVLLPGAPSTTVAPSGPPPEAPRDDVSDPIKPQ